mgnify:CR=1 FL=1
MPNENPLFISLVNGCHQSFLKMISSTNFANKSQAKLKKCINEGGIMNDFVS